MEYHNFRCAGLHEIRNCSVWCSSAKKHILEKLSGVELKYTVYTEAGFSFIHHNIYYSLHKGVSVPNRDYFQSRRECENRRWLRRGAWEIHAVSPNRAAMIKASQLLGCIVAHIYMLWVSVGVKRDVWVHVYTKSKHILNMCSQRFVWWFLAWFTFANFDFLLQLAPHWPSSSRYMASAYTIALYI